jgi:DNA-binding NarL/FixJ family response regulator
VSPRITKELVRPFADTSTTEPATRPSPKELARLTDREREILLQLQLAAGLSNQEIAAALYVTEATIFIYQQPSVVS